MNRLFFHLLVIAGMTAAVIVSGVVVAMVLLFCGVIDLQPNRTVPPPLDYGSAKSADLSGEDLSKATTYALAVQSERDYNHPNYPEWKPEFGKLIEDAHAAGKLSADQWAAYAVQGPDFRVDVAEPVRVGDPVPVRLQLTTNLGPTAHFRIEYQEDFELHDHTKLLGHGDRHSCEIWKDSNAYTPWIILSSADLPQPPPATWASMIDLYVDLWAFDPQADPSKPLAHRRIWKYFSCRQLPINEAARGLNIDTAEHDQLQNEFTSAYAVRENLPRSVIAIHMGPLHLPTLKQMTLSARAGGREWLVSDNVWPGPDDQGGINHWEPLEFDAKTVDLVIRPVETSRNPYDVHPVDIGKYEVVLHDVQVR